MKILHWILGLVLSAAAIIILLITSFQIAAYADFGFYEKEYEKYDVLPELDMKMDDLMYVTHEMMEYLRGDREKLEVITTVEGKEQDFFNEKDRMHMKDVRVLFIGGLRLRGISILVLVLCACMLLIMKADWRRIISRAYQIILGVTAAVTIFLGIAFTSNFTAAFEAFHQVFFEKQNSWIFDPTYDYMIRMLPEGLFADMLLRIGVLFVAGILILLAGSIFLGKKSKK